MTFCCIRVLAADEAKLPSPSFQQVGQLGFDAVAELANT
jgi:hypothetical protein